MLIYEALTTNSMGKKCQRNRKHLMGFLILPLCPYSPRELIRSSATTPFVGVSHNTHLRNPLTMAARRSNVIFIVLLSSQNIPQAYLQSCSRQHTRACLPSFPPFAVDSSDPCGKPSCLPSVNTVITLPFNTPPFWAASSQYLETRSNWDAHWSHLSGTQNHLLQSNLEA